MLPIAEITVSNGTLVSKQWIRKMRKKWLLPNLRHHNSICPVCQTLNLNFGQLQSGPLHFKSAAFQASN
jgi:hypothetical protein